MSRNWFFVTLLVPVGLSLQAADFYEASYNDSQWSVTETSTECRLAHQIPGFGSAYFRHAAGELLEFSLKAERGASPIIRASLSARSPDWMHGYEYYQNFPVSYDQVSRYSVNRKLTVTGEVAELMLNELGQGRWPTFVYLQSSGASQGGAETRVAVSAINFFEQFDNFLQCRSKLPPYGLAQISKQTLYFDSSATEISTESQQALDIVIAYLEKGGEGDVMLSSALKSSQTDKKWWEKRVVVVRNYLTQAGVNANKIKADYSAPDSSTSIKVQLMGPETLRSYYYGSNKSSALGPKSMVRLREMAEYIANHFKTGKIVISSYTDSRGSSDANMKLSQERGEQIKAFFASQGVDSARVVIKAYGESRSGQFYREQSAQSRRVDIDLVS